LERFLQLAAEDNIRVANLTSAAQYFHLLRRQALLLDSDPRPLIIMTPKSLLRQPRAGSSLTDLAEGRFQRVIDDPAAREHADDITRLVLCTGKVYIDLLGAPGGGQAPGVAVARVEELYSFPAEELRALLGGYPSLREVVWLQEEPHNMGAWSYVEPRLRELLDPAIPLAYVGRAASASPAEGSLVQHTLEQARIIAEALQGSVQPSVVA
jgi:2-oxoglutarate dehydrogenase E1 component